MKINVNQMEWDDEGNIKLPKRKNKKKVPKHKEPKENVKKK